MLDDSKALLELKSRYVSGKVSALIGSGFSKNVSAVFPLWDELLKDIVDELYFSNLNFKNRSQKKQQKLFKKKQFKQIIQIVGYLNIIDQYISHKGFREAIEVYIEDHLPRIDLDENKLIFKDESIQLNKESWSAHALLLSGNWRNIYTTNYDCLLENAAVGEGKSWKTVKSAQQLAIDSSPSIIKLHGSLHEPDDSDFSFDGKYHHRYIISRSDYENYPQEHEAFTQLMRISLLQETFCIIGFSGDDPNFMSWIEWVRNVLVLNTENANKNDANYYRIFIISIGQKSVGRDRELFYDNHRISVISLRSSEVLQLIGGTREDDNRTLIKKFLNFLYDKSAVNCEKSVWLRLINSLTQGNYQQQKEGLLLEIKNGNKTVKNPSDLLFALIQLERLQKYDDIDINIAIEVLNRNPLLLDTCPNLKVALEKSSSREAQIIFNRIDQFKHPRSVNLSEPVTYETILNLALSLNFNKLSLALKKWKPSSVDKYRKFVFESIFPDKRNDVVNSLKVFINQEPDVYHRYDAAEFLYYLDFSERTTLERYKNQSITGMFDYCRQLNNRFAKEKIKIKVFDTNANENSERLEIDKSEALPLLHLFIDTPLINTKSRVKRIDDHVWFPIFKACFEDYPFLCLFLSLFITDENELTRIGQEFSYSDYLHEQGIDKKILIAMLSAVLDSNTPHEITCSLFWMAAPLLASIEPEVWRPFVDLIIDKKYEGYLKHPLHGQSLLKFFASAQKNGLSIESSKKLLIIFLKNKDLYQNSFNKWGLDKCFLNFENMDDSSSSLDLELNKEIDDFIRQISCRDDFAIVLHIKKFLNEKQLTQIASKIPEILKTDFADFYAWRGLLCVSKETKQYQEEVKEAILSSGYLWGISHLNRFPTEFIYFELLECELNCSGAELLRVFEKLKTSFEKIKKITYSHNRKLSIWEPDYLFLLDSMNRFVRTHSELFEQDSEFKAFQNEIRDYTEKTRGYGSLTEGIISKDSRTFVSVLNEIIFREKSSSLSETEIQMIINRILFSVPENFINCLDLLKKYIEKNNSTLSSEIVQNVELVLRCLTLKRLQEIEVDIVLSSGILISIADLLLKSGRKSEGVDYWLDVKQSKRFHWQTEWMGD